MKQSMTDKKTKDSAARFECSAAATQIEIRLGGDWLLHRSFPDVGEILTAIQANPSATLVLADDRLGQWDTALLTFLKRIIDDGQGGARQFDATRLPDGVRALLDLAYAVGERAGARREVKRETVS
jgi:phospholipid/cholesterol/gamma-HCH transport system permease protein